MEENDAGDDSVLLPPRRPDVSNESPSPVSGYASDFSGDSPPVLSILRTAQRRYGDRST